MFFSEEFNLKFFFYECDNSSMKISKLNIGVFNQITNKNENRENDEKTNENSILLIKLQSSSPIKIHNLDDSIEEEEEFHSNFLSNFLLNRIFQEIIRYTSLIQKYYRKYMFQVKNKRVFLLKILIHKFSCLVAKIQSYTRKLIIQKKYRNIIKNLPRNYYLLNGDSNNSEISNPKTFKLIIYGIYFNREIMTFHEFFYSKSFNKFYLFLNISLFDIKNYILVNFVADGIIFNNYNYKTLYKSKEIFYNIINSNNLETTQFPIYTNSYPLKIRNTTNYSSHKLRNSISFLQKKKTEKRVIFCPFVNSNENLKLTKYAPILKPSSKNISLSNKSSKKSVKFCEIVFENR